MKQKRIAWCGLLCAAALMIGCVSCGTASKQKLNNQPLRITVWTYYNGVQLETFQKLVQTFNETVGKEQGIQVESHSQGNVNDLTTNVMDSAMGKVGADPMPNIFSAYADNAHELDQMGMVADLTPYLTQEEQAQYIDAYLAEGDLDNDGSIKIFPVAKATELLFLNDTDWQVFAQATGASYENLATLEGLVETAKCYYDWTDAQTEQPNDGRALFGRDAMANYLLIGAQELGCDIFQVDEDGHMTIGLDRDTARRLWNCYYVPFVQGQFCAAGRFRSDDIKTGNILAYVGSVSSASFFPDTVRTSDTEYHKITLKALPAPHFQGTEPVSVQQGAGMVVTSASSEEVEACVTFLKWFTAPENDIAFSVQSGYLPVSKQASQMQTIYDSELELSPHMEEVLSTALDVVNETKLYTTRVFTGGSQARAVLKYVLSDRAEADWEIVSARLDQGQSMEEATAEFLSEEHFETWYQNVLAQLRAYEN